MNGTVSFIYLFFNSHQIIEVGGILLLCVIIYVETGILIGLVLPGGGYMFFVAGMLCGTHYLDIHLIGLVGLLIVTFFLGDLTGYFKGKWLGSKLSIFRCIY